MKKVTNKEKYLVMDNSLCETDEKLDFFKHGDLSDEIANLILNTEYKAPYNIALIGKWGLGKTSLLNLVKRKVSDKCKVISINAWKYEKEDLKKVYLKEIYRGIKNKPFYLISSILKDLKKYFKDDQGDEDKENEITFYSIFNLFSKYKWLFCFSLMISILWQFSGYISMGLSIKSIFEKVLDKKLYTIFIILAFYFKNIFLTFIIPSILYFCKKIADKNVEKNVVQLPDINYYDDYDELIKLEIEKSLTKSNKEKIVVIIDDLDRLSTCKMVETLNILKILMEFPKCIFIVPFDDTIIKTALNDNVIKNLINEHQIIKSELILDKLFAFKFYLPPLLPLDLKEYALDLVSKEMPDFKRLFVDDELDDIIKDIIIYPGIETPRQIKKLLNLYSINYHILLNRLKNNTIEMSILNLEGKKILAILSVLQADFNEFYDTLFIEPNNIKIVLSIHNENELSFEQKIEKVNESIKYLFDIDKENKIIAISTVYQNLINFLNNIQFVNLDNILPYLYLKQDKVSIKYGSKINVELTNAAESLNIPTVILKLKDIGDQKNLIFSIIEESSGQRKINVINCFCMAFESIDEKIRNPISNKISKEISKIYRDVSLKYKINYSNLKYEKILEVIKYVSIENNQGISKLCIEYINNIDSNIINNEFVSDIIKLTINYYNNISLDLITKIKIKIDELLKNENISLYNVLLNLDINTLNEKIYKSLFGTEFFMLLCSYLNSEEIDDDQRSIFSNWLIKSASYFENADEIINCFDTLSKNEKNLKYINKIFINDAGDDNDNK